MSDITVLSVQRKIKPKIENVLPYYLDGRMLKTALDFVAYLRADKMNPAWTLHNAWKAAYKGKPIFYIRLGKEWVRKTENVKWVFTPYLNHIDEYEDEIFKENWQHMIWDDLHYCRNCGHKCPPGIKSILGKEFSGLCHGIFYGGRLPVSFVNPDEAAINRIKKLLEFEKNARMVFVNKERRK